jgi:SH3 domain protein
VKSVRLLPIGFATVIALFGAYGFARADTQYVSDRLEVALRAGESTRYKILKLMGFVSADQLQVEPAARDRLGELEALLAEVQQTPDAVAARLARLSSEYVAVKSRYDDSERQRQRLEQELATIRHASANVLDITNDRERLRIQVAQLTRERADLEQANRDLNNQTNQHWFLIGSGVLAGGGLLGVILPNLRFGRRRGSWGTL